jgi:tetratricopeptide (TPR) repeat protein
LELVFEHRNYLPSFGPWFAIAVGLLLLANRLRHARWLKLGVAVYVALLASTTHLRAWDWSSADRLFLTEAERHPRSVRANFSLAERLISALPISADVARTYDLARFYLLRVRELNPANLDALFGLVVLNLQVERPPEPAWIDELTHGLRHGVVDPLHVSTAQFSYLAQWHMAGGYALPSETVLAIFEAALANPRFDSYGRAGILTSLRAYYLNVLHAPEQALVYAKEAVRYWPQRWHYQKRLVELLVILGRFDEARLALSKARSYDAAETHVDNAAQLDALISQAEAQAEGPTGTPGTAQE